MAERTGLDSVRPAGDHGHADSSLVKVAFAAAKGPVAVEEIRVRAAFAKVNRDLARPGEWIQEPGGQWVKK